MLAIRVTASIASFRRPRSRLYLGTHEFPPPSTCYGFLLSLIGEENVDRHVGVRLAPAMIGRPAKSTVLVKIRRLKVPDYNHISNSIPDKKEVLTGVDVVMFVDSTGEAAGPTLEERVCRAIQRPDEVGRWGTLYLGDGGGVVESLHLLPNWSGEARCLKLYRPGESGGRPEQVAVWPDYRSLAATHWNLGSLEPITAPPAPEEMFAIAPR